VPRFLVLLLGLVHFWCLNREDVATKVIVSATERVIVVLSSGSMVLDRFL
jgi:DNA-binding transcriptional regulator YbjK